MLRDSSNILLVGAAGQLGRALLRRFPDHDVVRATRANDDDARFADLTDTDSLDAILDDVRPDIVLNAGAYTWVDGAEESPEVCLATNVEGPAHIARWAAENDATVVSYSSDYVFDGTKDGYVETDDPNPLNVYGESKLRMERALAEILPDRHIVIRTAWVYGPDEREMNFAVRLVKALESGEEVRVPADQSGTPTFTDDIARTTRQLLQRNESGLFHVVGPDSLSRIDLSRRVCEVFDLDAELLVPVPTAELDQGADRPWQVRMSTEKIEAMGLDPLRGVDQGLRDLRDWWINPDYS